MRFLYLLVGLAVTKELIDVIYVIESIKSAQMDIDGVYRIGWQTFGASYMAISTMKLRMRSTSKKRCKLRQNDTICLNMCIRYLLKLFVVLDISVLK